MLSQSYVEDANAHVLSEVHTDCQFQVLPNSDNAVTRFKINLHNLKAKSERHYCNRKAVKLKTNENLNTELNDKGTESDTRFGHEEEKDAYHREYRRTEDQKEKFDEDGDLILDRHPCQSLKLDDDRDLILDRHSCQSLKLDEDGDLILERQSHKCFKLDKHRQCPLNKEICTQEDEYKDLDCIEIKDNSEETPVKKKIKLEMQSNTGNMNSILNAELNIKDDLDCDLENTPSDKLIKTMQSSLQACQHCNANYESQKRPFEFDTSEKNVFVNSERLVSDRIKMCKNCVKEQHSGEDVQKEVKTGISDNAESFRKASEVSDTVKDNDYDSSIYYINIKHSLSTELNDVGEQVWHGSLLLSDYIICNHGNFDDKVIVDLGAGVGLSSIVAAMYAKMMYCTDTGEKVLSLAESNILTARTCPTLPRQLCDVHVKELDWFKGMEEDSSLFSLTKDDIDRINNSDILIAADVIYDFDITDAFFNIVKQIMSHPPCKTLYIGLEKRIVFTCEDLTFTSPGYNYFRLHLDDLCSGDDDDTEALFEVEQIDSSFPQFFQYNRIRQLELWKITATFKS
ncbi:uncharacterized protein LOC132745775 [Ruditapes philippinarum]|uniref:uncharacterized protein LOC132745775 n=1 Tax=Ruditapes philippinarum TaxID=129788 RepID=UPI00295C3295|nr:uncharacterized protein LOC132745775 [Ruditapes philippinarum]